MIYHMPTSFSVDLAVTTKNQRVPSKLPAQSNRILNLKWQAIQQCKTDCKVLIASYGLIFAVEGAGYYVARGVSSYLAPITPGPPQESVNEICTLRKWLLILCLLLPLSLLTPIVLCTLVGSGRSFNSLPIAARDRYHDIPRHSAMT